MKRILIISFSDLAKDPRVYRQIILLSSHYKITTLGFADSGISEVHHINCRPQAGSLGHRFRSLILRSLRAYEQVYWNSPLICRCEESLRGESFDLVIANDILTLPLAFFAAGKVIFDAHEFASKEFEDRWQWRLLHQKFIEYLCAKYIPSAHGMMTVCQGIAEEYHKLYGVLPLIIQNAPSYRCLEPQATLPDRIRLVHHGAAIPSRKLELMLDMMKFLDERFSLDMVLVPGDAIYMESVKASVAGNTRIQFPPPLPMAQLPEFLNQYDIGLFLLPPSNFNYYLALPNKFFEFIQARLAVAIGPSPEMARLIEQYQCGVVADSFDPENLAKQLNQLDAETIDTYKWRSHAAAQDLCFERNAERLLALVEAQFSES